VYPEELGWFTQEDPGKERKGGWDRLREFEGHNRALDSLT
jgi:hypothetical protein